MAAKSRRKTKSRKSSSGFGIFVMGLIVGSIGTVLAIGIFEENPLNDVGSGLGSLLNDTDSTASSSKDQSSTSASVKDLPAFKFDYPELLLEEEYVLPPPKVEQPSETETKAVTAVQLPPESETTGSQSVAVPIQQTTVTSTTAAYVIQVGSFRKFEDADRVKASLAINGYEAYIQKVSIEGRGDFFRVRLGPFKDYAVAQDTTASLTTLKLQPLVFRVKTSG